jgi:ATP-dependent Clp protease ATP-binding subunit ClpX
MMLDVMFDLPSRDDIKKCIITKETILEDASPQLILEDGTIIDPNEEKTSA